MSAEKTPEEQARSKRAHANSMIAMGVVTTACALAAGMIALSGRGDMPDWMFGGGRAARAPAQDWTRRLPLAAFETWGAPAFARARKENKLILLFVGPSYNESTARMLAETFGDPASAALANARFVPVRVRSEEFPDLDRRYRAGGWPTTALLLSDGVVLDAGTSMAPEAFRRWAVTLADKAAAHPEALASVDADARRRLSEPKPAQPPPSAADAELLGREKILSSWDPARRTFDREGPRFPHWERIAALERVGAPWARSLAAEAAKGALIFQDPSEGGFYRAAAPDGSPLAREKIIADQAGALDVLCGAAPEAARRELAFLDRKFRPKNGAAAWLGWRAGHLDADGRRASGRARLGEEADLSRAVLRCALSSREQKAYARRVIERAADDFTRASRRRDQRLLLEDAVGLGTALLAAGETKKALAVWKWMEKNLATSAAYWDRPPTGLLPPEADRLNDPTLNARALSFARALAAAVPIMSSERNTIVQRAEMLFFWLASRSSEIDPAVLVEISRSGFR